MLALENDAIDILLVEDNPADVEVTQESFQEGDLDSQIHVVNNGLEAIQFLRKTYPYEDAVTPDIILLDLNLPKKNGHEVLEEIKADPQLRIIPVFVLTSSQAEEDIIRSYDLHANCYLTKPVGLDQFIDMVRKVENFWFDLAKLPKGRS